MSHPVNPGETYWYQATVGWAKVEILETAGDVLLVKDLFRNSTFRCTIFNLYIEALA